MIQLITQALAVIAAIAGVIVLVYKNYWSPKAKARKDALLEVKKAINDRDPSKITANFDRINRNK